MDRCAQATYRGLDAAVEAAFGGTTAWVSDIDPGASKILAHHWPDVPNLGDLTTVDWAGVEPVDIVCGGYPCQPFSDAGLRKGTADERHIWPHIATALRVLRPRYAIFENVSGHLRRGFDTVLADLADLGFDAEWCVASAAEVGAPHRRKRLFIVASTADAADLGHQRSRGTRERWAGPADGDQLAADAERLGLQRQRCDTGSDAGWPAEAAIGRRPVGSGHAASDANSLVPRNDRELPPRRDAVRLGLWDDAPGRRPAAPDTESLGHGNAGAPGIGGLPPAAIAGRHPTPADTAGVGRGEGRPEPARLEGRPGAAVGGAPDWGAYAPAIDRWERAIGRPAPWAVDDRRRLSPAFVEWLMGLPAGHVTDVPGLSRNAQLKALGNGVVPQQAAAALRLLLARMPAPTALASA